jgi:hypothetical protein
MRKQLGKPTRELFFSRLRYVAPDFHRCSTHDIKGFTWTFLRQQARLRQWLRFQRHKYDDAFTVELAWSCMFDNPTSPPLGGPDAPFTPNGCRFRLGAFWDTRGDFWWRLVDPPVRTVGTSSEDYVHDLFDQPVIDMDKATARVRPAVEDAIRRIQELALPYFERVSQWAASQR